MALLHHPIIGERGQSTVGACAIPSHLHHHKFTHSENMIAKIYPNGHPDIADREQPVRYFDIRKLTEAECLKLMGVDHDNITKLVDNPKLARSSVYKLAGNSIVVDCMYYIFKQVYGLGDAEPSNNLFAEPIFKADLPNTIRMVTLCSGYDSQLLAMDRFASEVGKSTDLVWWAEYDPDNKKPIDEQPAVIAHNSLFPQYAERNLGDMTAIDWDKVDVQGEIDWLFCSSPCQSISNSGLRHGMARGSGTRSAILWYTEEAIRKLKPKFFLQENVKAMIGKRNIDDFREWQKVVEDCGYTNYYTVMNAKDYGIPQNRERVFMLSVRKDLNLPTFVFPKPFTLNCEVADYLDDVTDEKYYLQPEAVIKFLQFNEEDKSSGIRYVYTDKKLTDEQIKQIQDGK